MLIKELLEVYKGELQVYHNKKLVALSYWASDVPIMLEKYGHLEILKFTRVDYNVIDVEVIEDE